MIDTNTKKLAEILMMLILVTGVFVAIDTVIKEAGPTEVPEWLEPYWSYIVMFFNAAPVVFLVGFGRNVLGYARNYFRSELRAEYDVNKLYETWMLYAGGITTILAFVPPPYDVLGAAAIVLIDIVRSEIKHLRWDLS